jgi:hypothetical protein
VTRGSTIERSESGRFGSPEFDLPPVPIPQPGKTMHGSLPSLVTSNPAPVQVHPRAAMWPLAVLVLGGVLTIAWMAFLLWAGLQVLRWMLG